jgi:ABC-type multidrug transport system ATPase subunit
MLFYFLATASINSFTFALIALYPTQAMGRVVGLGVLMVFFVVFFWAVFSWLFQDAGFYEKRVLSIFPVAVIPYTLGQMVTGNCMNFSVLHFPEYYPVSMGFLYMAVEAIVYYIVFIAADSLKRTKWYPPFVQWSKTETGDAREILVDKARKVYEDTVAVCDISFRVEIGETLAIIGPNGSGKSSLLGMIAGASDFARGRIVLAGLDVRRNLGEVHRLVGFCPQVNLFMNELNAIEWVEAICGLRGEPDFDYTDLFAALGLDQQTRVRIGDMSGGNKRKVCLATALLCNPAIVVLDEATSGVDFTSRTRIWSLISGLKDTTVIMATHTLEECEKIADRIMVLAEGEVSVLDTPTQLRQSFKCGYLLETDLEHADELERIVREMGLEVTAEHGEQGIKIVIPAEEHQCLSRLLREITFPYLMSIQSLEEKIFSHIQETEMAQLHRRDTEIDRGDMDMHPAV